MIEVREFGVQEALRRPLRAWVLVAVSRILLLGMPIAVLWAGSTVRAVGVEALPPEGRPLTIVSAGGEASDATSIAALIEDLQARVSRDGSRIVALHVVRGRASTASVRLVIDLDGSSSAGVDRLVASLLRSSLVEVSPASIDPIPSGLRLVSDASVDLAAAPPASRSIDPRPTAVVMSEIADRSGVEMRGLAAPTRPHDPVRMSISGTLAQIGRMIAVVEEVHSAPVRFQRVAIERSASGAYDASLTFALSEDDDLVSQVTER